MKRKLTTLVLAMVLAVSGLILVPSSAKAQQCTWTLYVNGQKYSTNSSYYASGQLKMVNNVVYLNSFTGQTLQAIPGGVYGDDDAPVLTISLTGTNTLTGGKLDNDTYGMIYSEPRYGGSGAASKVVIEGSGTLNLTYKDYPSTRAQETDYNLIRADYVSLGGSATYNLSADIYGLASTYTLYGVNADATYFTGQSLVSVKLRAGKAEYAAGSSTREYQSEGTIQGVKGRLNHNSSKYAVIDTNSTATKSQNIHCVDTLLANSFGIYLYNIAGVVPYTGTISKGTAGIVEYKASDKNMFYTAFVSTQTNSYLKKISASDIVDEAEFAMEGSQTYNSSYYAERTDKGFYRKIRTDRLDIATGQTWPDDEQFHTSKDLEYAYENSIYVVPMPGYQMVSVDSAYTTESIKELAKNKLGYTPDYAVFNRLTGAIYLEYSYVTPTITRQPDKVYDLGNIKDITVASMTPTEACGYDGEITWDASMNYEWFVRVYRDANIYENFSMDTFGGDMDGFEDLDTNSPALGFDESYKNFEVEVKGTKVKLDDAYKVEVFCRVHTIADYVDSQRAELKFEHSFSNPVITVVGTCKNPGTMTGTCSICGETTSQPYYAEHDFYVIPGEPATFTNWGYTDTEKCKVCGFAYSAVDIPPVSDCMLKTKTYTYDGKSKKPSVTILVEGSALSEDEYDLVYSSGRTNVGKYSVQVVLKNHYAGSKKLYFTINPKGTTISTLTKLSKGFKVTWKKQSTQTTGYQIRYSTSSKMTSAKTVTVTSYKTTSKSITKLKAKKKYYVQVRTYKTVSGTKYYSSWSKAKYVTTK